MLFNCLLAIRRLCINLFFWYNDSAAKYRSHREKHANDQSRISDRQREREKNNRRDVLHIIRCKNMLIKCSAQFPFRPITTTKMD